MYSLTNAPVMNPRTHTKACEYIKNAGIIVPGQRPDNDQPNPKIPLPMIVLKTKFVL